MGARPVGVQIGTGTTRAAHDCATTGKPARYHRAPPAESSSSASRHRAAPPPGRPTRRDDCAARAGPDAWPERIREVGGAGAAVAQGNLWHRKELERYNGRRAPPAKARARL